MTTATRLAWLTIGSVTAGAGAIVAGIGLIVTAAYLISRAAERPPIAELMLLFVAVRFFGLARPALRYVERLVSHDVTFRLLRLVRRWFVDALLPLSPGQLAGFRAGDLLSRLASDVDALQDAYLRALAPALVAVLVIGSVGIGVAFVHPGVAVILVALLCAYGAGWSWLAHRQARTVGAERNEQRRGYASDLVMLLQGADDILAFGYEPHALAALRGRQGAIDRSEHLDGGRLGLHAAAGTLAASLAAWAVLIIALASAGGGTMSWLWTAPLVLAAAAAFEAVEGLPAAWQFAEQTRNSAGRVLDVVRTPPAVRDGDAAAVMAHVPAPALRFERVRFGYATAPILIDFDLEIRAGEHLAIVGPTGAGKSTLLLLLARSWDPWHGRITWNGRDLREVRLADLRRHTAVWPQHVHVFNESLRDNVRLARPHVSDDEVRAAVVRAGLEDFLTQLPNGLDTRLGEFGARMSAGERQRLGLARLVLTDAPLVLADEPTAHLDVETERAVLQALFLWARGRTLVMASHRPAALAYADRVVTVGVATER